MKYQYGIMINDAEFIKIGDRIDVFFKNQMHMDGELEDINVQDDEIVVDGEVIAMEDIVTIVLPD